jgi:tripartite-type tricarboxylate transporter receptor subunit TctC
VKELIDLAKNNPGKYNYASSGNGGGPHLSAALFTSMSGVNIVHIPYKGSGPALTDLLGGQVHMQFSGLPPLMPFIKSGKLRALGVAGTRRSSALPDVPTIAEAGLPGYTSASWQGLAGPSKLPKTIITRLYDEARKFVAVPEIQSRLIELGAEPVGSSPDEFTGFIRDEFQKWARVIREIGVRID